MKRSHEENKLRKLHRLNIRWLINSVFHGLIEIGENGFWRKRYKPTISLIKTARLFNEMNGKVIIEIGSGIQGPMAGSSMIVWTKKTKAEKIVALDLEEKNIDEVKKATIGYSNVEAILGDGIQFLKNFSGTIDLLYLDYWTFDQEGTVPGTGRANSYLEAYMSAKEKMNAHSMILIDDTDHIPPWKHTLIIPEARKDNYRIRWTGRQTLLIR